MQAAGNDLLFNPENGGSTLLQKLVSFYHTTWCPIPKDSTVHNHHYENLTPNIFIHTYSQTLPVLFFCLQWNLLQIFHHLLWMASAVSTLCLAKEELLSAISIYINFIITATKVNIIETSSTVMLKEEFTSRELTKGESSKDCWHYNTSNHYCSSHITTTFSVLLCVLTWWRSRNHMYLAGLHEESTHSTHRFSIHIWQILFKLTNISMFIILQTTENLYSDTCKAQQKI